MDSAVPPDIDPRFQPVWKGKTRTIACHMADLDGLHVPNSLAAVERCVEAGAARIELDLRFMADDTMAVFHDRCLDSESTGTGELSRLDGSALSGATYRVAPGVPIARFHEAVQALTGSQGLLQVDLKSRVPLTSAQVDALEAVLRPLEGNCIVGSEAHWNLAPLARRSFRVAFDPTRNWHYWPGRPAGLSMSPARLGRHGLWDDAPLAHVPGVQHEAYVHARIDDLIQIAPDAAEWMVDLHTLRYLRGLGFPLGDLLHDRGIELAAWTIQDRGPATTRARVTELFDLGADTVIADRAAIVSGYLAAGD